MMDESYLINCYFINGIDTHQYGHVTTIIKIFVGEVIEGSDLNNSKYLQAPFLSHHYSYPNQQILKFD